MSNCKGCGIVIACPGGCGQICLSDCTECVGWCEPAVLEFDADRKPLDGSVGLKVCTKEIGPDSLRDALQAYLATPLEWAPSAAAEGPGDIEFSGSVEELLDRTGLRLAASGDA